MLAFAGIQHLLVVAPLTWALSDNRSMNGVLVNSVPVGQDSHYLKHGDIITFGRKVSPPEFEFVFEDANYQAPVAAPLAPMDVVFAEHIKRIAELQRELDCARERKMSDSQQRAVTRSALDVADIQSELLCTICRDWVVHASTLECSHTFCWSCIDQWLRQRKFECPVCRCEITRQPVRSHAIEAIVQKTVERSGLESKADYHDRVCEADKELEKVEKLREELERSFHETLSQGKNYVQIDVNWPKKEKEAFQQGAKDFTGKTREMYCRFRGLTVQWVHSADESQLNQALHNLGLQACVSSPEHEIRKRLLMFLHYG
jgi:hypothetical protein